MKQEKLKLLNEPVGTEMYLVEHDRQGDYINVSTVTYNGYKLFERDTSYFDPGKMKYPIPMTEYYVLIKFGNKKYTMKVIPYWSGQRAFDTDEHLGCGDANYPYIDVYFTTNKDKFKKYIEDNKFLETLSTKSNKIAKTIKKINNIVK